MPTSPKNPKGEQSMKTLAILQVHAYRAWCERNNLDASVYANLRTYTYEHEQWRKMLEAKNR